LEEKIKVYLWITTNSTDAGSVQKILPDRAETLDAPSPALEFTQNPDRSPDERKAPDTFRPKTVVFVGKTLLLGWSKI
jgi:hypothetical protein